MTIWATVKKIPISSRKNINKKCYINKNLNRAIYQLMSEVSEFPRKSYVPLNLYKENNIIMPLAYNL